MVRISGFYDFLRLNGGAARMLLMALVAVSAVSVQAQPPETIRKTSNAVSPEMLSASFADVAKRVEPAVVSIDTKGRMPEVTIRGDQEDRSRDLEDFIRRNLPPRPSYAVGSGFVVDPDGYILTNYHVVKDAERITVKLEDGSQFVAKVTGADEETDLAVLKIEAGRSLPYISFGNSDAAQIGDWVLAIGSPFGLVRTVTAGIISQTNRATPEGNPFQKFLQTDAAINRGNSGGPLVDMNSRVIGVNSQIATSTGDYNGIGFALPSNEAEYVYLQIRSYGKVKRGYLGVYLDSVGKEFADVYGLKEAKGAVITSVRNPQGAAANAGLIENDIILTVDGKEVINAQDLIGKIASIAPGQAVSVGIMREAGPNLVAKTLTVRLDERPGVDIAADDDPVPQKLGVKETKNEAPFGLSLEAHLADSGSDDNFKGRKGVIITRIDPGSFISEERSSAGDPVLGRGDLIERINRKPVSSLAEFKKVVDKLEPGDSVVLHVSSYDSRSGRSVPRIVQFTVK